MMSVSQDTVNNVCVYMPLEGGGSLALNSQEPAVPAAPFQFLSQDRGKKSSLRFSTAAAVRPRSRLLILSGSRVIEKLFMFFFPGFRRTIIKGEN